MIVARIVRVLTETMVYEVGRPMPTPPGFPIEPFVVVNIETLDEEDEDGISRPVLQIMAKPDPDELKQDIPPLAEGEDPNLHQMAVEYNHKAKQYEKFGHRVVAVVPHHLVVRTERLVGRDEFEQIKDALTKEETSDGEKTTPATGATEGESQQPTGEAVQGQAEEPSELQPDG